MIVEPPCWHSDASYGDTHEEQHFPVPESVKLSNVGWYLVRKHSESSRCYEHITTWWMDWHVRHSCITT